MIKLTWNVEISDHKDLKKYPKEKVIRWLQSSYFASNVSDNDSWSLLQSMIRNNEFDYTKLPTYEYGIQFISISKRKLKK